MAIVFITGSTQGLGRAAAQSLLEDGHQVVLHARSTGRAATIAELASRSAGIVVGDLHSAAEVRSIADQVNAIGRMDAIIHNAGVYTERSRGSTPEGHAGTLAGTATIGRQRCCIGWRVGPPHGAITGRRIPVGTSGRAMTGRWMLSYRLPLRHCTRAAAPGRATALIGATEGGRKFSHAPRA